MEWGTDPSKSFGKLLEDANTCDVVFQVGGQQVGAHKLVFAAHSPVFKAMFFGKFVGTFLVFHSLTRFRK